MSSGHIKKIRELFIVALFVGAGIFLFSGSAAAQIIPECNWKKGYTYGLGAFVQLAVNILRIIWGILGSLALVMFVWGGFLWLTARGEENQIKQGWDTLINAVIGILIVLGSWVIINTIILALTNPGSWDVAELFSGTVPKKWTQLVAGDVCVKVAEREKGFVEAPSSTPSIEGRCVPECSSSTEYCHNKDCVYGGAPAGALKCKDKRRLGENCLISCQSQCAAGLTCKKELGLAKCLADVLAAPQCAPPCAANQYCHDVRYGLAKAETPSCKTKLQKTKQCDDSEQCATGLECRPSQNTGKQCLEQLPSGPIATKEGCIPACAADKYCHDERFTPKQTSAECKDKIVKDRGCQDTIQCATGLECSKDNTGNKKCLSKTEETSGNGICVIAFREEQLNIYDTPEKLMKNKLQYYINVSEKGWCERISFSAEAYIEKKAWCKPLGAITSMLPLCEKDASSCLDMPCIGGWHTY